MPHHCVPPTPANKLDLLLNVYTTSTHQQRASRRLSVLICAAAQLTFSCIVSFLLLYTFLGGTYNLSSYALLFVKPQNQNAYSLRDSNELSALRHRHKKKMKISYTDDRDILLSFFFFLNFFGWIDDRRDEPADGLP